MKLKKKYKTTVIYIVCIILLFGILITIKNISKVYVGKVVKGKIEYIDRIASVTNSNENKIVTIEFKNNQKLIDNCIMTSKLYDDFKTKKSVYNVSIKDYLKLNDV